MACRALSYKVEICPQLPEIPPPTPTSYLSCKGVSCWLFYSTDAKNKILGVCLLGQARTQANCDLSQLHSSLGDHSSPSL